MDIEALAQDKIEKDTEFQTTLVDLSDEDRNNAIATKKSEIIKQEYSSMSEKAKKAEEVASNQKIRAEKAEDEIKKGKNSGDGGASSKKDSDLSSKDVFSLMNAKVPEQDVEEVVRVAKGLGKSISEALQDDVVKTILSKRSEERDIANAANTGNNRRTTQKVSPDKLLENLSKGEVPEAGSSDAEEIFWARRGGRRK